MQSQLHSDFTFLTLELGLKVNFDDSAFLCNLYLKSEKLTFTLESRYKSRQLYPNYKTSRYARAEVGIFFIVTLLDSISKNVFATFPRELYEYGANCIGSKIHFYAHYLEISLANVDIKITTGLSKLRYHLEFQFDHATKFNSKRENNLLMGLTI